MANNDGATRKRLIKERLAELVDPQAIPNAKKSKAAGQRRRTFGQGLLVLSVFILVAGLYAEDSVRRAIFVLAAILHAVVGAWYLDRTPSAPED